MSNQISKNNEIQDKEMDLLMKKRPLKRYEGDYKYQNLPMKVNL